MKRDLLPTDLLAFLGAQKVYLEIGGGRVPGAAYVAWLEERGGYEACIWKQGCNYVPLDQEPNEDTGIMEPVLYSTFTEALEAVAARLMQ